MLVAILCAFLFATRKGKQAPIFDSKHGSNKNVSIDSVYLYSSNWDEEDPFAPIIIDTVRVINIKSNYVLYDKYNKQIRYQTSNRIDYFIKNIKPLNKK
jgi:hypothetical protein